MSDGDLEAELRALETDGFVVLEGILSPAECADLSAAIATYEAARPMGRNDFEGTRSQRVYSLAGKGDVFLRLAENPRVVRLLDALLMPNWLLSTMQSIRLHPGETHQPWHTDDGFYLVPRPRARLAVSTIWALEDFTEENGGTEVIPGSHTWAGEHPDERAHEPVTVCMRAGSVVVFDGALWHRGGANRSRGTRLAISPQYCQPWLRTQESQLLIVPPPAAALCTPRMQAMLGYSIHPPFVGQVDGMHPLRLVDPTYRSGNRASKSHAAKLADELLARPSAYLDVKR